MRMALRRTCPRVSTLPSLASCCVERLSLVRMCLYIVCVCVCVCASVCVCVCVCVWLIECVFVVLNVVSGVRLSVYVLSCCFQC